MNGRKILIVEDEMIAALDLRTELHRLGYRVTALVKSGEEAVRLAQESAPDLVLMDLKLAGSMDGVEASRRIHEITRIPVVYLTANPDVFVRNPDQMQESYICLSKPFSIPDLQAVVKIALNE